MTILDSLTEVFRTVFEDEMIHLEPEMTANDIEGWDSLSHVVLILAIEETFHITFTQKELLKLKNIGDLHDTIASKQS